jgi:hypothetical protein
LGFTHYCSTRAVQRSLPKRIEKSELRPPRAAA